jgi:hypothetical protein
MINREIIQINNSLFIINRKIPERYDIDIKWFKFKTKSDKVFKSQGYLFFVDEVQDVEPIDDGQLSLEF